MKILQTHLPLILIVLVISSCVQETYQRKVTFEVDARKLDLVNSISVRGDMAPLSWNENFVLGDEDKDSIYSGTLIFDTPYDYFQFKFVLNENEFELKGKDNRRLNFEERDEILYRAEFDSSK